MGKVKKERNRGLVGEKDCGVGSLKLENVIFILLVLLVEYEMWFFQFVFAFFVVMEMVRDRQIAVGSGKES